MRTVLTFPFRLAAAVVAIPTRLSLRLLRFSTVFTFRATRAMLGSSLISFGLGVGLGWFAASPTGRDLIAQVQTRLSSPNNSEPSYPGMDSFPAEETASSESEADEAEVEEPAVSAP